MLYEKIVRPGLYRWSHHDPELVHERTIKLLDKLNDFPRIAAAMQRYYGADNPVTVAGIDFPSRLGLAAGMDKNGHALHSWSALGFGFVELGTVTPHPQAGNPKPRLFLLPHSHAVLNRMGFNNAGALALADRLAEHGKPDVPLGISIGKAKSTPVEQAISDYTSALLTLYPYADYFAVNVSSPNTAGLRSLQDRSALAELLSELSKTSMSLAENAHRNPTPLFIKVAPDLNQEELIDILEICRDHTISGIIATNTTTSRPHIAVQDQSLARKQGGLSGKPLTKMALARVRFIHEYTGGTLPIIGVGGILTVDDAQRMMDAGASLLQMYSGLVLRGPGLVRDINRKLTGKSSPNH